MVGARFLAEAALGGAVPAALCLLELPKNLLQRALPDRLLRLTREAHIALLIVADESLCPHVVDEVAHAVFIRREIVLAIELIHPVHRLVDVAARVDHELHKDVLEPFKRAFVALRRDEFSEAVTYHGAEFTELAEFTEFFVVAQPMASLLLL